MIIYEITAIIEADLREKYEKYMKDIHIPDLMATGYFQQAFFTLSSENRYRIQYHAYNQKALDDYLQNEATRLREHFQLHFPEGVILSRETWEVLQVW